MVIEAPISRGSESEFAAHAAVPSKRNHVGHPTHPEESIADRKLGLLRRTGLFGDDLKGCSIQRACTADDLRQAYRLVHDIFICQGFIKPDPGRMRVRIYETTPETATFVAKVGDRVVAVLSVVEDTPELGLPSDSAFKPELDTLRRAGRRLCEATNQAVANDYRRSAVPTELMRCAVAMFLAEGYDEAIATVSPSHTGFYDLLGFRQIAPVRNYSKATVDPVIALSMDVDQYRRPQTPGSAGAARFVREFLADGNHFLSCVKKWAEEARQSFLDPELLKQLFIVEKNFLARLAPEELAVLLRRWGPEVFSAVTADVLSPILSDRKRRQNFRESPTRDVLPYPAISSSLATRSHRFGATSPHIGCEVVAA